MDMQPCRVGNAFLPTNIKYKGGQTKSRLPTLPEIKQVLPETRTQRH